MVTCDRLGCRNPADDQHRRGCLLGVEYCSVECRDAVVRDETQCRCFGWARTLLTDDEMRRHHPRCVLRGRAVA